MKTGVATVGLSFGFVKKEASISIPKPNFFERTQNYINQLPVGEKIVANVVYGMVDDAYVSLGQTGKDRTHLNGSYVYNNEIQNAGVGTFLTAIPFDEMARPLIQGINAAKFSSMFKGTFVTKLQPATRGLINRTVNSQVVYKQTGLFLGAAQSSQYLNTNK